MKSRIIFLFVLSVFVFQTGVVGETPAHDAARRCDFEQLTKQIKIGANLITEEDSKGNSVSELFCENCTGIGHTAEKIGEVLSTIQETSPDAIKEISKCLLRKEYDACKRMDGNEEVRKQRRKECKHLTALIETFEKQGKLPRSSHLE